MAKVTRKTTETMETGETPKKKPPRKKPSPKGLFSQGFILLGTSLLVVALVLFLFMRDGGGEGSETVVDTLVTTREDTVGVTTPTDTTTPLVDNRVVLDRINLIVLPNALEYNSSSGDTGIVEFPLGFGECKRIRIPFQSLRFMSRDSVEVRVRIDVLPTTARPCA